MKRNESELTYQLLSTVFYDSDVTPLIKMGISYSEIGQRYAKLISDGLVQSVQGKIVLTEHGMALMNRLQESILKNNVKYLWIKPKIEYQIPHIDENDVFLPNHFE